MQQCSLKVLWVVASLARSSGDCLLVHIPVERGAWRVLIFENDSTSSSLSMHVWT
ncbi:MAG: hypothetical protein ACI9SE_002093 [Neolewinella sp.]|jgi:hypothetical protein